MMPDNSGAPADAGRRARARGARLALLLFLLACLALAGRPVVRSDGTVYYAVSESLARDGDFDLANQRHLNAKEWRAVADFRDFGGRFGSIYSGGMALMNFPFLFPAFHLHDQLGFLRGLDALGQSLNMVPLAYSLAILMASFVYFCLAALLTFETARAWVSGWWAAGVTAAVMCSLPVVLFGVWEPSYSHTADTFLIALALWLTVGLAQGKGSAWRRLVLIAAALGLATFVRVMNVILFVPWGVYLLWLFRHRRESAGRILGRAAVFALGALPFALLLLWYNNTCYGHPLRTAYNLQTGYMASHHGFGEGLVRWAGNVVNRLVHLRYGAFWWSPLCAVAVVGLMLRARNRTRNGLRQLCLWGFLATVLVMGVWNIRGNRGHGAGPRFFIESFPFLAIGLAALIARLRRGRFLLGVGMVVLTLYSLTLQGARISWQGVSRTNYLMQQKYPGDAPTSPRKRGTLARILAHQVRTRPLGEWMKYTPFELLQGAFDDSVVAPNEPSRGTSRLDRVFRGTQPSLGYLVYLAVQDRLPVLVTELELTAGPERRRGVVSCVLDRPVPPSTQFVLDIFEYDSQEERRRRRWGRFVSEVLPTDPPLTELTAVMDVEAGTVRLLAGDREIALPGHRVPADHRDVIVEAGALQVTVLIRGRPRSLLERARKSVFANPWQEALAATTGSAGSAGTSP